MSHQAVSINRWIVWGALIGLFSNLMLYGIPPPKAIPFIIGVTVVGGGLGGSAAFIVNYIRHWRQHSERGRTRKKIKANWRPLLVLATVVWAVIIFTPVEYQMGLDPDAFPIILGPFVIATAIYLLFPKRKN